MITIKLPTQEGLKSGIGTQVFDENGTEIEDVSSIDIRIRPDSIIMAVVEIPIEKIEGDLTLDSEFVYHKRPSWICRTLAAIKDRICPA